MDFNTKNSQQNCQELKNTLNIYQTDKIPQLEFTYTVTEDKVSYFFQKIFAFILKLFGLYKRHSKLTEEEKLSKLREKYRKVLEIIENFLNRTQNVPKK